MLRVTMFDKSSQGVTRAGTIRLNSAKSKFKCCRAILIVLAMTSLTFAAEVYDLTFSTYFGGSDWEHARDVAVDKSGNIYVVGGTASPDFPTTPGAYSQSLQTGGAQEFGPCDVFIVKFAPDGRLLWSTLIGGPNYDRAYGVEVDGQGYVYAAGRAGPGFPVKNAFGADFDGVDNGSYGMQNAFVLKMTPDGSDLVWSSYVGVSTLCRDLAIDEKGDVYVPTGSPNYPVTEGAFQQLFRGGETDWAITKLSPTGALLGSTLIGGSDRENPDGIYVGSGGRVFVTGETQSADFPLTAGAYQSQKNAGTEAVLITLSSDLKQLLYATYLGGGANDNGRSGCLGADGSLYLTGSSDGAGWPAKNAYQSTFAGGGGDYGNGDCILARLTPARTITVDPAETYQTISGWEMVAFALEPDNPAFPNFKDTLFDMAVHDAGINRLRLEIRSGVENSSDTWSAYRAGTIDYQTWRSSRYATVNDNADPNTIDWSGFHFSDMDNAIERIVNPLRAVLEADGDKLYVNVNYVAFTGQIKGGGYIHDDPAEYAEFVLATYLHLQDKYGWIPDSWEVILEPDNVSQWNGTLVGRAIVAAAGRLKVAGFEPVFVAPSTTNMGNAVTYFDRMVEVPGAVEFLRELSYHRYGGVSLQNLQTIAGRAEQYGIDTSMLEWWSGGNGYRTLHEDLKVGNNSAWQQGVLAGAIGSEMALYTIDDSDPANPRVLLNDATKFTRQYYRFVRPGAIRIKSITQQSMFDPLAFINKDGSYVVVVKCDAGGDFSIGGLAAGTYGVKYTTASRFDADLPDQTIRAGQAVLTGIPAPGVLTVYGKPALPDDQPPIAPAGLAVTDVLTSRLTLTWDSSTDNAAVAGYKIYRDGIQIGFSQTNSFEDKTVEPAAGYAYNVSAYGTASKSGITPMRSVPAAC